MDIGSRFRFANGVSTPIENWELELGGKWATLVSLSPDGMKLHLEEHVPGLEEWDNCVEWGWHECFGTAELCELDFDEGESYAMFLAWLSGKVAEVAAVDQRDVLERAEAAFWAVVASAYPQAKTGDLGPDVVLSMRASCEHALSEWVRENVLGSETPTRL